MGILRKRCFFHLQQCIEHIETLGIMFQYEFRDEVPRGQCVHISRKNTRKGRTEGGFADLHIVQIVC